ncbi:MAG: T9SS type A sorting domain-containing protein [Crocinitomicaceae bacterium]|nr:T9SS type A sorting domain-containing protein [Crocinitomicaceae bacterium]
MKKNLPIAFVLYLQFSTSFSQYYTQYFDGLDSNQFEAIFVYPDTSDADVWQFGPPQKTYFESASTIPDVLITDTVNYYPDSVSTYAWFQVPQDALWAGGLAIQWVQTIDLDTNKDGAFVEFSSDSGDTWQNAMYHPDVYQYYGWDFANEGTDHTGEPCFTGTDTLWKNVWLCFLYDYLGTIDNLSVRYRLSSDTIQTNQEGWMLDNLMVAATWFHPVAEQSKVSDYKIYPSVSQGPISITRVNTENNSGNARLKLLTMTGQLILNLGEITEGTTIDLSGQAAGRYLISIENGMKSEMHEIIITK